MSFAFCRQTRILSTSLPRLCLSSHWPLQSRNLAPKSFRTLVSAWLSLQMRNVLNRDRVDPLQAVGDPFQHSDLPLCDEPLVSAGDEPTKVTTVPMEFASSDLWRNSNSPQLLWSYPGLRRRHHNNSLTTDCVGLPATTTEAEMVCLESATATVRLIGFLLSAVWRSCPSSRLLRIHFVGQK